jgi:hypothetical protein
MPAGEVAPFTTVYPGRAISALPPGAVAPLATVTLATPTWARLVTLASLGG